MLSEREIADSEVDVRTVAKRGRIKREWNVRSSASIVCALVLVLFLAIVIVVFSCSSFVVCLADVIRGIRVVTPNVVVRCSMQAIP